MNNSKSTMKDSPLSQYLLHRTLAPDFAVNPTNNENASINKSTTRTTNLLSSSAVSSSGNEFRTRDSIHKLIRSRIKLIHDLNIETSSSMKSISRNVYHDLDCLQRINNNTSNGNTSNDDNDDDDDDDSIRNNEAKKRQRSNANIYQRMVMDCPKLILQSDQFDIEGTLQSILNDDHDDDYYDHDYSHHHHHDNGHTLQIIQNAFSIAAMSVVNAVKEQIDEETTGIKHYQDHVDDDDNDNDDESNTVHELTPALLRVVDKIDCLKYESFQLASQHDILVKKNITSTSTSTSSSRKRKSASNTSTKSPTKNNTTTTKSNESTADGIIIDANVNVSANANVNTNGTTTSPSTPSSKRRKRQSDNNTNTKGTTSPNTKNNNMHKANHDTIPSTPTTTLTTNTATTSKSTSTQSRSSSYTSSTSATDTRLIMTRAILCSAASQVFRKITPDYKDYNGYNKKCMFGFNSEDNEDGFHSSNDIHNDGENDMSYAAINKKQMHEIDILDIPQNYQNKNIMNDDENYNICDKSINNQDQREIINETNSNSPSSQSKPSINMSAVTRSAEIFAMRTIDQTNRAVNLSNNRRKWRMDCAKRKLLVQERRLFHFNANDYHRDYQKDENDVEQHESTGILHKWLTWNFCAQGGNGTNASCVTDNSSTSTSDENDNDNEDDEGEEYFVSRYASKQQSEEWNKKCLPRIVDVMNTGSGHLILHDLQWRSRFSRVAEVLKSLAISSGFNDDGQIRRYDNDDNDHGHGHGHGHGLPNHGPHLIITTQVDFGHYMGVLYRLDYSVTNESPFHLRALGYTGTPQKRRRLRKKHFTEIGVSGLIDTPFNVIVTTYSTFIQDYLHFCHIPFQAVVLDDGMSWLGTASQDPNALFGKVFDKGLWNHSDNYIGVAGVDFDDWDFGLESTSTEIIQERTKKEKRTLIGLTARHRIIIASSMHSMYRGVIHVAPVPGLMSFLFPQFMDVVREEWDRSRLNNCNESIEHMRKLLCRGVVVYTGTNHSDDMHSLAIESMIGKLTIQRDEIDTSEGNISDTSSRDSNNFNVSTDAMIKENKIVQSRRFAASWLRHGSPIRFELGTTSLDPIISAIKARASSGYVCEEIVTASSQTSSGAAGVICGPDAYKNAVRSGRTFTSEQALKQHIAAYHAPPGTWLCRICGIDCGISLARTHHERSCASNNALGMCHV